MTDLDIKNEILKNKLNSLSTLEKSEFHRRFRSIYRSKAFKMNLIKEKNAIQQASQSDINERKKEENRFGLLFICAGFINYFFTIFNANQLFQIAVLVAFCLVTYVIKNSIFDSKMLMLNKSVQFEIDRYTHEIDQYGIFFANDNDLFFETDEMQEPYREKLFERGVNARIDLQIEILNNMGMEIDVATNNLEYR